MAKSKKRGSTGGSRQSKKYTAQLTVALLPLEHELYCTLTRQSKMVPSGLVRVFCKQVVFALMAKPNGEARQLLAGIIPAEAGLHHHLLTTPAMHIEGSPLSHEEQEAQAEAVFKGRLTAEQEMALSKSMPADEMRAKVEEFYEANEQISTRNFMADRETKGGTQ